MTNNAPQDLENFIQHYHGNDDRICFSLNPASDPDPFDLNEPFRSEVIDHILANPDIAPLKLLRDIYKALTDYSEEAWSIDERVGDIGKLMLVKGRSAVISEYIEGACKTFDADSATNFTGCPRDVAVECLEFAKRALSEARSEEDADKWQYAVDRFESLKRFSVSDKDQGS